ncbi:MAG: OmpA family protein, partial [Bacteroidota bacterium]
FNQPTPFITEEFRHENLIVETETSFFNVLILKNQGERREEVFIEINVPLDWSLIAFESRSYLIEPGDSLLLPVRAAPSKNVQGEIGYSLIASINNRVGETLTNAYCFIKIPRKSDFRFRPITRMTYFDQQTGESELSFRLINRGNTNEMVYLTFRSTPNVALENERENLLNINLTVRARSDTTITLKAQYVKHYNINNGSIYRVDLTGQTEESTFNTSFWFNLLDSEYTFSIPESEKMLIAEIAAQNLMSNQPVNFAGGVRGNTLYTKNREINYLYYHYGTGPIEDSWRFSRSRLAYRSPAFHAVIGDISGLQLKYGSGKGIEAGYNFTPALNISVMASENPFRPIQNAGIKIEENYTPAHFTGSYSYSRNLIFNNTAHVAGTRLRMKIAPQQQLQLDLNGSEVAYDLTGQSHYGFGLIVDYAARFRNTTVRLREQFGSPYFYGQQPGRHNFTGRIVHDLSSNYQIDFSLFDREYRPLVESITGISSEKYVANRQGHLLLRTVLDRGISVYAGPQYERKATNSFFLFDEQSPFVSHSAKVMAGARISDGRGLTFNPSATLGMTFITQFSDPDIHNFPIIISQQEKSYFNSHVSINVRKSSWGGFLNYFYGPYSVNQEISRFYYDIPSHSVRIMPYFENFIYRDLIKLSSRLGYLYDFSFRTSRINFNNQLDVFLQNDLQVSLINSLSYQVAVDQLTEESYRYSNNYVEVRLTKAFNWNQPRIKYFDLKVNLFKDLNGNLVRDFNEPGVGDIMVTITSIDPVNYNEFDVGYEPAGAMVAKRLLTGADGTISYENLPRGLYRIELENTGSDQSNYFPDQNEVIINLTENETVYIPYLERNKIFGRIIMNRSRLSTLGRIEISNIKITATDSKDRQTSTLTDDNGYFEMYVPSVDSYVVSINNIFRDHFNLRQNDFRANLNGFKQFEVNFVFDEIRRQIEFTPSSGDVQAEIRRVGRTNLAGTVRDANTLQPIRAIVEIVDNSTGNTIQQTVTDRNTGRYTISFATGEDYMIVVSATGYWMHTERLILDQFLTIQDAERDILLESITIGARFQLNNLSFAPGSAELPTEALPELDRLINQLKQNPNVRIRIEGHSDALETLDNPNLSMQRAEAIMRYMIQNGFSNIEFTGLKDSKPVAPSDTEENRRRNRRVEIIIVER